MPDVLDVGFTGSQNGMTDRQGRALVLLLQNIGGCIYRHGMCVGGDEQFHELVRLYTHGAVIYGYPAVIGIEKRAKYIVLDHVFDPKPPLERNHTIVLASGLMIAAPRTLREEVRSGTWATVRYARKLGKPVIVLDP